MLVNICAYCIILIQQIALQHLLADLDMLSLTCCIYGIQIFIHPAPAQKKPAARTDC